MMRELLELASSIFTHALVGVVSPSTCFCARPHLRMRISSCIHGVNYDTVKNTVAVYRVYKTYFCSFPFSQLLFTEWAKIKFTFCFRTTVVLRYEMSSSVFTNSSVPTINDC